MRHPTWFARALVLLAAFGLRTAAAQEGLSAERLKAHVTYLASPELEGRGNGAPGGEKARAYLLAELKKYGLSPGAGGEWTQPFSLWARGTNVLARLPGREGELAKQVVVVSAHYDHLGVRGGKVYHGANDNACGVAVLLELARTMAARKERPARTVLFASWDAEEDGLVGSFHWTLNPTVPLEQVVACVDMDLIGRDTLDLFPTKLFVFGTENSARLSEAVSAAGKGSPFEVLPLGSDLLGPRCDFWNFRRKQVPALFFSRGEHADYHKPTDTADRVDYARLFQVAQVIERTAVELAGPGARPTWRDPVYTPSEAASLAALVKSIVEKSDLSTAERWLLGGAARSLEAMSKQERLSATDRNVMKVLVGGTLLRGRIKPYQAAK